MQKFSIGTFCKRLAHWLPQYLKWARMWVRAWLCTHNSLYNRLDALHKLKKESKADSSRKFREIEGGLSFCKKTGQPYEILNAGEKIEVVQAAYFEEQGEQKILFDSPPIYLTVFKEADVYGATNLITIGNTALSDMADRDRGKKRYDVAAGCLIGAHKNGGWIQVAYHATDRIIDAAINCIGWACTNYYHFMFEILSRLAYVDGRDEYRDYPILVDVGAVAIPQMKDMLDMVNRYHHPVITIGEYERVHVKNLVYVSRNLWIPPGMRRGIAMGAEDYLMSRSVADHIRDRVLGQEKLGKRPSAGRKIFLSRRDCSVQRLENTEEIEQIFVESGYQIAFPGELSFEEEVALFNNADVIAGVTGAAFTNIVFCHEGAQVGMILSESHPAYDFANIANMVKVKFIALGAELMQKGEQISLDTFRLNPEKCRRFIKTIEENAT